MLANAVVSKSSEQMCSFPKTMNIPQYTIKWDCMNVGVTNPSLSKKLQSYVNLTLIKVSSHALQWMSVTTVARKDTMTDSAFLRMLQMQGRNKLV